MELNELGKRKLILRKYSENPSRSGSSIAKELKFPVCTVNRVLKQFKVSGSIERAEGSGKKPGPADKKLYRKVIRSCKENPGLSDGDRAGLFGTSRTTVRKYRLWHGYKSCHAIKQPNRTVKQNLVARKRARLPQISKSRINDETK